MKPIKLMLAICIALPLALFAQSSSTCYDRDYVEVSKVEYQGGEYSVVSMLRSGERIRAKYFAAEDDYGRAVYDRYQEWQQTNSNIILISSGTYWNEQKIPVGLTIDNGVVVNNSLVYGRMDALTIVYATGGIVVSNLNDGNLKLSGGGVNTSREFDLRGSTDDLYDFVEWAQEQEATVFQTHLLVYDDKLKVSSNNSSTEPRERRFLAVGRNDNGDIVHLIVHRPEHASFYKSTSETKQFLNDYEDIEVIFMINLDTGYQDIFELRNWNCSVNQTIKGPIHPREAANLLVYYFK